jgi:hypothetical protein
MGKTKAKQLVICVDNEGYAASLEKRKIYFALRDASAEKHGLLRIVDESGEDYLYPKTSLSPDCPVASCEKTGVSRLSWHRRATAPLVPAYSVCTSTTPDTALIAPAICGETLNRPGSFISTSVSRSSIKTSETSPSAPPAVAGTCFV